MTKTNEEIIKKFFEDQNNIWKSEAGLSIKECKQAEIKLLNEILTEKDKEREEAYKQGYRDGQEALINPVSLSSRATPPDRPLNHERE